MIEIFARKQDDGSYKLRLTGGPSKSVIEVRWQDTLSGVSSVDMTETEADGSCSLGTIANFGQHFVPSMRVLNDKSNLDLAYFTYADAVPNEYHLVQTNAKEPQAKTEQTQPSNISTSESKGT